MSKSADTSLQEEGDETMLLDDGFSIVDDINAGLGAVEGERPKKGNGEEDIDDKEVKKEEVVKPCMIAENSENQVKKETVTEDEKSITNMVSTELGYPKEIKKEVTVSSKTITTSKVEVKASKTSSTGDNTLILNTDEELGPEASVLDESSKIAKGLNENESKGSKTDEAKDKDDTSRSSNDKTPVRKKNIETSFVWVSNISKFVKASGLKKHFSECGKVNTAKVVTNGKVFFGYVEFESAECALACVKKMNNSILAGKKILVSRTRPDVTKKPPSSVRKTPKNDPLTLICDEAAKKKQNEKKERNEKVTREDSNKSEDNKKGGDKSKIDDKKSEDKKKNGENEDKNEPSDGKQKIISKKPTSLKSESIISKTDDDLKKKLTDCKKKMDSLKQDLERSQIEVRNLRRRLTNEQRKSKAEEMRGEKYRSEVRSLSDQLKQTRSEYDKVVYRLTKKHKLEMEKVEYHRETLLKQKEDMKKRQEDLDREYKKLDEAKKALEHSKRSRKSRSITPPSKRFRGREGMFSDHHSPPPPPKLSSEVRSKTLADRPPSYYEEKKSRGIYDRLGDYGDKSSSKESNGRHRSAYPGDVVGIPKSPWDHSTADTWKKPNSSATYLKPYMERYGSTHASYQVPSTSYYPPGTSDYLKHHNHFDIARKY